MASVAELPLSIVAQSDDPRLQSDNLLVVVKSSHRVMLFSDGLLRHDRPGDSPDCWRVGLGTYKDGSSAGAFDKQVEGDRRTPVGWYRTSDKPVSSQYHSILIHYPDERHAKQALDRGAISTNTYKKIAQAETAGTIPPQNTALGGNILLHGGGSSTDWTWGCIALNNIDQDELRELLPTGMRTRILILP
ncbi:L,D-transpeptidase family protein [Candidatus Uhrbacteria bacterium]|nr:L,D-transpeptidase family protein [Candidatus Uhrbacteria bacterium]